MSSPNVDPKPTENCPVTVNSVTWFVVHSLDKSKVSNLKMAYREQLGRGTDWDLVEKSGDPCSSERVGPCLSYVSVEQKPVGVPVTQADPMLAYLVQSLAQRITITNDIAVLYSPVFIPMRQGHDISFTKGSQVLRLLESRR